MSKRAPCKECDEGKPFVYAVIECCKVFGVHVHGGPGTYETVCPFCGVWRRFQADYGTKLAVTRPQQRQSA